MELRVADFECNTGDILVLKEFDPKTKNIREELWRKK
ncbi:hypothetical protein HY500_00755 [Candidatus Woesearchaeota archaeon]|nr:hypothetical protein [Candidatus Woesearchaeota archaeon]